MMAVAVFCVPDPDPEYRKLLEYVWSLQPDKDDLVEDLDSSIDILSDVLPNFYDFDYSARVFNIRAAVYNNYSNTCIDSTWITKDGRVLPDHVQQSADSGACLVHTAAMSIGICQSRTQKSILI